MFGAHYYLKNQTTLHLSSSTLLIFDFMQLNTVKQASLFDWHFHFTSFFIPCGKKLKHTDVDFRAGLITFFHKEIRMYKKKISINQISFFGQ